LDHELRLLLRACQENVSHFRETLRVARAGHDAGNLALVIEAVERLIGLEREALKLIVQLQRVQTRFRVGGDGRSH